MAIQRAEDKTLQLQARGSAIDELLASGALNDPTGMAKDDITTELERLSSGSDVDNQLEAMKRELSGGPSTKQIEAGKTVGNASDQGVSDAEEVSAKGRTERGRRDDRPHSHRGPARGPGRHASRSSTRWTPRSWRPARPRTPRRSATALDTLLARVREVGTPIPLDRLVESDFVLPMADSTLEEVEAMMSEEGLIPG